MATPYMGLDLPVVSSTLGPEWASLLNEAIEAIDAHDHTPGKGRLITSAAININDDLSINTNNLRNARSYNMQNLGTAINGATDIRSLYVVNGELYYNDGVGNQIQLTAGGALNASSVGGIGGDYATSTANVYYNSISKTFTFDQDTNRRAKLAVGDLLIGDTSTASTNAITVKSPTSLAAAYTLRLPNALPGATQVLTVANNGDVNPSLITDPLLDVDAVTNTKIINGAVTTTKIADDNVTQAKLAASAINDSVQKYNLTGSGNFTVPAGVTRLWVQMVGGGGGGGGASSGADASSGGAGGGGGGAGQHLSFVYEVTPGQIIPYSCGSGGSGGAGKLGTSNADGDSGTPGGATYFGRWKVAGGGGGGGGVYSGQSGGSAGTGGSGAANGGAGGNGGFLNTAGTSGAGSEALEGSGTPGTGGTTISPGDNGGGGGGAGGPSQFGNGGNGGNGMNGGTNSFTTSPSTGGTGAGGGGGGAARSFGVLTGQTGAAGGAGAIDVFVLVS